MSRDYVLIMTPHGIAVLESSYYVYRSNLADAMQHPRREMVRCSLCSYYVVNNVDILCVNKVSSFGTLIFLRLLFSMADMPNLHRFAKVVVF